MDGALRARFVEDHLSYTVNQEAHNWVRHGHIEHAIHPAHCRLEYRPSRASRGLFPRRFLMSGS